MVNVQSSSLRALSVVASLALVAPALAQEKQAPGQEKQPMAQEKQPSGSDPMAGWTPPKVKNEKKDRQEIQAFFKKMDAAGKKGDLDAALALVDFPVLMVTDDKAGQAGGESWDREQYAKVMEPFYKQPMPPATHAPTIVLVSDSLAVVSDAWTMSMGGKKTTGRSGMLLIRRDGEWKAKAMMEGGWGDMSMPAAESGAAKQ